MEKGKLSEKICAARDFETKPSAPAALERPSFHVTPTVGWMNDPNGFSFFQGEYHLFYQYHPYSTSWGPMHWGHSRTRDFIKWERLPCALAPDTDCDAGGCFSGTAVEWDNRHLLMYTSVGEEKQPDGTKKILQTQSVAFGDGTDYVKADVNPVITADMLPPGSCRTDFRDPKIWKEEGLLYALVGSKHPDGSGQMALFTSEDALSWEFVKILDYNHNRYGKMWECPDFFLLDGKQVLIVSPQFMRAEGLEFHNGNNAVYFTGDYDKEAREFRRGDALSVDYGMDFYAPQTVETADGRRVMIGWMSSWDNYLTPEGADWSGMMTIPRELHLKDGRLIQNPVRELQNYRQNEVLHKGVHMKDKVLLELDGIRGRSFDMTVSVEPSAYQYFKIMVAADEELSTTLCYDLQEGLFTTDRMYSGMTRDMLTSRSMYVKDHGGAVRIRVVMDKYAIEVFINDGEKAMSTLIYTPLTADRILFEGCGAICFDVTKYDLLMD